MVKNDGTITERANRDLWEDMADTLNEYRDSGMKVAAQLLHQEKYPILSTLEANPIMLALETSNGTDLMKYRWFEKTFRGGCWQKMLAGSRGMNFVNLCGCLLESMVQ